ncbi:hypothetical protein GO986_09585 [Deinococcus sp. HMF7620]|uniref:DUF7669 domain-containing protein n=1 Tax=Deinococcus arboris TaxID=2682977 RepID=A0A7C9LM08_9DEIO|nr:hypothetical protein [Deinococcus arboris]MVN87017.1 hypothetical protein [Deinococcus arboris]
MTCRTDILAVARDLAAGHPEGTFSMQDIVQALRAQQTTHTDAQIRRHVRAIMCANSTEKGAGQFPDLEWVARGRFRLLEQPV